jgi:hypothetical protein
MLVVFITSLSVLIFMVFFKYLALSQNKEVFWSRFLHFADSQVHRFTHFFESKYRLYKKIFYLFTFEFLPSFFYEKTVKLKDYIAKRYYASADSLKGNKKMLRTNGSVSSFLQSINKEENITKIEDNQILGNIVNNEDKNPDQVIDLEKKI